MAKANPLKGKWVKAVDSFIQFHTFGYTIPTDLLAPWLLDFFANKARERKNTRDRSDVWYKHFRDLLVDQMLRQGISERQSDFGSTHYMLVPNFKMEGEKGREKYQRLVDLLGPERASQVVNVTTWSIPKYIVRVTVTDPRFKKGQEIKKNELHEAEVVTKYTFVGDVGSTAELLWWTTALGNRPALEVGMASKRAKSGKPRKRR